MCPPELWVKWGGVSGEPPLWTKTNDPPRLKRLGLGVPHLMQSPQVSRAPPAFPLRFNPSPSRIPSTGHAPVRGGADHDSPHCVRPPPPGKARTPRPVPLARRSRRGTRRHRTRAERVPRRQDVLARVGRLRSVSREDRARQICRRLGREGDTSRMGEGPDDTGTPRAEGSRTAGPDPSCGRAARVPGPAPDQNPSRCDPTPRMSAPKRLPISNTGWMWCRAGSRSLALPRSSWCGGFLVKVPTISASVVRAPPVLIARPQAPHRAREPRGPATGETGAC